MTAISLRHFHFHHHHHHHHSSQPNVPVSHAQEKQLRMASFMSIGAIAMTILCISLGVFLYNRRKKNAASQSEDTEAARSADRAAARMTGANGGPGREDIQLRGYQEEIRGGGMDEQGEAPPPYRP